ncbi:nuclease-related domain-containing protein [Kaarinaea lacus]
MEASGSQAGFYGLLVVAVIVVIGAAWYIFQQVKKSQHQRHVHKVLESLGVKYLRDVVLPDGLEGMAFIDYLLLAPDGVVVLDIHYSEGHLFGGNAVDQWTQVINNKTFKFNNPLYDNQAKCQAVLWNVENILGDSAKEMNWKAHGWIAFTNAGNFPKGIPDHVSMIDELKNDLQTRLNLSDQVNESTLELWDKLHDLSITTRAEANRR